MSSPRARECILYRKVLSVEMNKSTINIDLGIEGLSSNMHITKEINNYDLSFVLSNHYT